MKRDRPTYEGRPLARPDEEVVDQGLGFDLQTLASRRQILRAFGLGATVLGLAAGESGSGGSTSSGTSGRMRRLSAVNAMHERGLRRS